MEDSFRTNDLEKMSQDPESSYGMASYEAGVGMLAGTGGNSRLSAANDSLTKGSPSVLCGMIEVT